MNIYSIEELTIEKFRSLETGDLIQIDTRTKGILNFQVNWYYNTETKEKVDMVIIYHVQEDGTIIYLRDQYGFAENNNSEYVFNFLKKGLYTIHWEMDKKIHERRKH